MTDLTTSEKTTLLRLARCSIEDALGIARILDSAIREASLTPSLEEVRGAFVTLREKDILDPAGNPRLRGCIGTVEPEEPLFRSVIHNAARAARSDPRFPPVEASELPGLSLEISALTPLTRVEGPQAILPGRDGVTLEKEGHRAVFLPQVATEQGWDTRQLLEHLARKAGLPEDGWQGAELWTFRAEVFGEDEAG